MTYGNFLLVSSGCIVAMSDFDTKKIQTFFERSIFFFGYKLLIKALDWEFVNAGDVKFKYQTDLPPEKQIVTCFPDVRQVRANILLIFSFFKKNMVKALQILLQ